MNSSTLLVKQGADLILNLTITEKDTGEPLNLLDKDVSFIVAKRGVRVFDRTNTPVDHTDPNAGITSFLITNAVTSLLIGGYEWQVDIISPGSIAKTYKNGILTVKETL